MTLRFSKHFLRNYFKALKAVQEASDKQSQFLLQDLHHPSLHAKTYDEARDLWQARVSYTWRFLFQDRGQRGFHGGDPVPSKITNMNPRILRHAEIGRVAYVLFPIVQCST